MRLLQRETQPAPPGSDRSRSWTDFEFAIYASFDGSCLGRGCRRIVITRERVKHATARATSWIHGCDSGAMKMPLDSAAGKEAVTALQENRTSDDTYRTPRRSHSSSTMVMTSSSLDRTEGPRFARAVVRRHLAAIFAASPDPDAGPAREHGPERRGITSAKTPRGPPVQIYLNSSTRPARFSHVLRQY
jgi:hypothetical protein